MVALVYKAVIARPPCRRTPGAGHARGRLIGPRLFLDPRHPAATPAAFPRCSIHSPTPGKSD